MDSVGIALVGCTAARCKGVAVICVYGFQRVATVNHVHVTMGQRLLNGLFSSPSGLLSDSKLKGDGALAKD